MIHGIFAKFPFKIAGFELVDRNSQFASPVEVLVNQMTGKCIKIANHCEPIINFCVNKLILKIRL